MLRKDSKVMLRKDWEPRVPEDYLSKRQIATRDGKLDGRMAGSVRMANGKIIGGDRAYKIVKKRV